MLRVQADDPDAFEVLFDRFTIRAYRVAYAIAAEGTLAEDIVQDAFLSVWRSRATYRSRQGSVSSWVMGCVRHRAIDSMRRDGRHGKRRADEERIDERLHANNIEEMIGERDHAAQLRGVLATLPPAQRDVIVLAYFGELSTTEIANELSLPIGTVKGRMRLGLRKLRSNELH
jgi:RNA polymerase sigma-70 factor, ECF subfamily